MCLSSFKMNTVQLQGGTPSEGNGVFALIFNK